MSLPGPAPLSLGKVEALRMLAAQAGLDSATADEAGLAALLESLPPITNREVTFRMSHDLPALARRLVAPRHERPVACPRFTNGRPACFPEHVGYEISPPFEVLDIPGGTVARIGRAPVVLADPSTILRDFSSRYAPLAQGYAIHLGQLVGDAMPISGTALVLLSDIHPLNYCHWLVDELPRLAAAGRTEEVTVVVADAPGSVHQQTLCLAGVAPERIVALGDFQAVRADRLLVTSDLADMPHPGFKAAPWLLDFLRARIGFAALAGHAAYAFPRKLFVSRDDAIGRRIMNESELMGVLGPAGYERVTLAGRSLAEQVALFSRATHIVGAHGAGLTNIVFAPHGARLLEIFPASYGTPAYWVLAGGQGFSYATYVAADIVPGDRPQTDDMRIDVADFRARCDALI